MSKKQKISLKDFVKFLAIIIALITLAVMLSWVSAVDGINFTWKDYAMIVGGIGGPLAALSGFFLLYLSFLNQQEQIVKQTNQFLLQSFENKFFKLYAYFRSRTSEYFKEKVGGNLLSKVELFKTNMVSKHKKQTEYESFELYYAVFTQIFFEAFKGDYGYHRLKIFSKSIQSIIHSIEIHKEILSAEEYEYYYNFLVFHLSLEEKRVLFYYTLTIKENALNEEDKRQLALLLRRFNRKDLISKEHFDWLTNIK